MSCSFCNIKDTSLTICDTFDCFNKTCYNCQIMLNETRRVYCRTCVRNAQYYNVDYKAHHKRAFRRTIETINKFSTLEADFCFQNWFYHLYLWMRLEKLNDKLQHPKLLIPCQSPVMRRENAIVI
jgi:hypothetical protein